MSTPASEIARRGPVVLVVLDGWGIGRAEPGNAILAARTPVMDGLRDSCPRATLRCSGEDVGLPAGQMGNSEVGHLNLGAGFVVYQWITRIDRAIADGSLAANPTLNAVLDRALTPGRRLHLLGLVGEGGVHSHSRHLLALLRIAKQRGVEHAAVHAFTDGRDTPPESGLGFVTDLEAAMGEIGLGRIATVSGRYYAMDRDHRWDRTARAYQAIVNGQGPRAASAAAAIRASYAAGVTDEFIVPTVVAGDDERPTTINGGDAVIVVNFRADRVRQLTEALTRPDFAGFDRRRWPRDLAVATMTRYEAGLPAAAIFAPHDVVNPVARVISEAGLAQFHTAETEKYAHVTYFFNGGREAPFPGEERRLIPSPQVATYDLQPEMSAPTVAAATVEAIRSGRFPFVIVNLANCDMVGHTGVEDAAVRAVETVDRCLGQVVAAVRAAGGVAIVTADHGNAEEMIDPATGGPMTAHTTNPVPVLLVAAPSHPAAAWRLREDGRLCAVAPTLLQLLALPAPAEMTEPSLLVR